MPAAGLPAEAAARRSLRPDAIGASTPSTAEAKKICRGVAKVAMTPPSKKAPIIPADAVPLIVAATRPRTSSAERSIVSVLTL